MASSAHAAEPVRLPRPGRPWTVEDMLARANDEHRYELVRGDLLMMSPASPVQGRFAARLIAALSRHVEEQDLGEVYTAEPGFVLRTEPDTIIRVPDVAFLCKQRIPPEDQQAGFWRVAPDIAIEIISPSELASEIQEKVLDYLDAGVRLIWLVYPRHQTVTAYQSRRTMRLYGLDDTLDGEDVLPSFRYPLRQLFR